MSKFYKIKAEKLVEFCEEIFKGYGVKPENAKIVAESLVDADLRNVSSHGVIRLAIYVKRLKSHGTNGNPNIVIERETPVSALLDGGNGLGSIVSDKAVKLAIEKIKKSGIAVVGVKNSAHYGAAAYWANKMADEGMVGFSCSNVEPFMAVSGGKGHDIGNNPFSFVFPTKSYGNVCYDVACSKMAGGKILAYALMGKQLPENCFLTKDGKPTTDPHEAEIPLPFASHKGYGMAVVVEMLTSILTGSAFGKDIGSQYNQINDPNVISHLFLGFRIDLFRDLDSYEKSADEFVEYLRALPKADGVKKIYYPGELENISKKEKLENGLKMKSDLIEELEGFAREAGVPEKLIAEVKAEPIEE